MKRYNEYYDTQQHLKRYAHTDDMGYVQRLDWMEMMSKLYKQIKCKECGLFAIWKLKTSKKYGETK